MSGSQGRVQPGAVGGAVCRELTAPSPGPCVQVLFLAGVALTLGMQATLRFFIRRKNHKGSGFFLGGVALVVWGWTLIGFALEAYGFWLLFSAFFPTALSFLRRMPFLRQVLDTPAFKAVRSVGTLREH